MEASAAIAIPPARSDARSVAIPWFCHAFVVSATSILVGLLWDISWHTTIGRDSFWTPAHVLIYLGGVIAGCTGGFLVLRTTLAGSAAERAASVRVWGMRGPYGAWLAIWGAFAMIASAPFDDWWHNAYGLDVQILSPPHTVLAMGMMGVVLGAVVVVMAMQNRGEGNVTWFRWMYVYCAGVMVTLLGILLSEYCYPNRQHGGFFYVVACAAFPFVMLTFGRASQLCWPVTAVTACYTMLLLVIDWGLELFPATPKLAPIYNPLDHMAPFGFPLLLIVPAIGIDLVIRRLEGRRNFVLAVAAGATFFVLLLAVQWPFAIFLLSPAADNAVFMGGRFFSYADHYGAWMFQFWSDRDPFTATSALIAIGMAVVSAWLGLRRGNRLRKVLR